MYRMARGRKLPPAARVARMLRLFGSSLHSPHWSGSVLTSLLWGLGEGAVIFSGMMCYPHVGLELVPVVCKCAEQQLLTSRVSTCVAASFSFVPGIQEREGQQGKGWTGMAGGHAAHQQRDQTGIGTYASRGRPGLMVSSVMELVLQCCRV